MEPLEQLSKLQFTLSERPVAIRSEYRPLRRIALLALAVAHCHSEQASYEQLHVLNWALRFRSTRSTLQRYLTGDIAPTDVIVRFDPHLDRIVSLAVGARIFTLFDRNWSFLPTTRPTATGHVRVRLSDLGRELVESITAGNILVEERKFFSTVGRKITQQDIRRLFIWSD